MALFTQGEVSPEDQFNEDIRRWEWQKSMYEQQRQDQIKAAESASKGLSGLVNEYNKSFAEAKAANENRYQQMLSIADTTTTQQQADIGTQYAQTEAKGMQNLQKLGMANTTLGSNLKQGVQREKSASLNRLADTMQGTKLGIIQGREDEYPDASLITSLASQLGSLGTAGTATAFGSLSGLQL